MLSWLLLLLGGFCEVGFVAMMKCSEGFKILKYSLFTLMFMGLSFYSLSLALKEIPIGVGYAVWAGIGAIGSVIVGMLFFNESRSIKKLFFISLIIIGIIGLKLATKA